MTKINEHLLKSLDITDSEIEPYIPEILSSLWELGSNAEYVIQLLKSNLPGKKFSRVLDLGCGKGATLIKLADKLNISGVGIDIVPEFIKIANQLTAQNELSKKLHFEIADIARYIQTSFDNDLVIYGYDSELLGDVYSSLRRLKSCTRSKGHIVLEAAYCRDKATVIEGYPNIEEIESAILKNNLSCSGKVVWEHKVLVETNSRNNALIGDRIERLSDIYPDRKQLFSEYMQNQIEESEFLENHTECATWLLKN